MANILALVPMNAVNFDSGAATDGQVLTADGSGGAGWQKTIPYIGIIDDLDLERPTQATIEAAFVATTGRASVFTDIAMAMEEFGNYATWCLLFRSDNEGWLINTSGWTAP